MSLADHIPMTAHELPRHCANGTCDHPGGDCEYQFVDLCRACTAEVRRTLGADEYVEWPCAEVDAAAPPSAPSPPPIVRPNGQLYRPRSIRVRPWDDPYGQSAGVLVLGTHDLDVAQPLADNACPYWHGTDYAVNPELGWYRRGFGGEAGELNWVHDAVRGAAGIYFRASDDPPALPCGHTEDEAQTSIRHELCAPATPDLSGEDTPNA